MTFIIAGRVAPAVPRRYLRASPRQLAAAAARCAGNWGWGDPGHVPVAERAWRLVAAFPVCAVEGPGDWLAWYDGEHALRRETDGDDGYFDRMEAWLRAGTRLDPLSVVEGEDGRFWLWDGYHRVAAARRLGLAALPAIVGYRGATIGWSRPSPGDRG